MICPRCSHSDRIANPFKLPPGFRAVLYDHTPFYKDRDFYQDTIRDVTNRHQRLASRNASLVAGEVYNAFLDNFYCFVKDAAHIYREVAVNTYNRYSYNHNISEILIGKYSRFCFFRWENKHQQLEVFVCCHEHE